MGTVTRLHAEKRTAPVTTLLRPSLKAAIQRLAAMQDRADSEYISHVLHTHVYGLTSMLGAEGDESHSTTSEVLSGGPAYARKGRV